MKLEITTLPIALLWCAGCATTLRVSPEPIGAPPAPIDVAPASAATLLARAAADEAQRIAAAAPALDAAASSVGDVVELARARTGLAWVPGESRAPVKHLSILSSWRSPVGSHSLGTTSQGRLVGASELELDGAHHEVVARARGRGTQFGTARMIDLLEDTAASVARAYPGSRLVIGNISYKNGGDIRWSVSHNSGRDVDLAFYVMERPTGKRVVAPDLIAFDDDGHAIHGEPYVFDVPRNWSLVEALLTHPSVQVQYLFISQGLRAKLLAHAERTGRDPEIIRRASLLLRQPTDSSPHHDHFHVRITCGVTERLLGCIDRGLRWDWVDWHEDALRARSVSMGEALAREADPRVRQQILEYLAEIRSPFAPDVALWVGMADEDSAVRAQAMKTASATFSWTQGAVAGAMRLVTAGTGGGPASPGELEVAYRIMRKSHDDNVPAFASSRIRDKSLEVQERAWAARAMKHHMRSELVPELLAMLAAEPEGRVRHELAVVLRRITNRAEACDWRAAKPQERQRALAAWQAWWGEHNGESRAIWVARGFAQIGMVEAGTLDVRAVEPMLAALAEAPDHIVYNINRSLREITGRWSPLEQESGAQLEAYWSKWWTKNKERLVTRDS